MKKIVFAGFFLLSWFAISAQAVTHHRWPLSFFASPEASYWFDHSPQCGYTCRYDGVVSNYPGHHGTDIRPNGVTTPNVRAGALGNLYQRLDNCGNNPPVGSACYGYGNHVRIQHPDGKVTINAHLQTGTVAGIGNISCGTIVGIMGNTGTSTGQHLHLEMWSDRDHTVRIDHFGGAYSGLVYWVSQNENGYGKPSMNCE